MAQAVAAGTAGKAEAAAAAALAKARLAATTEAIASAAGAYPRTAPSTSAGPATASQGGTSERPSGISTTRQADPVNLWEVLDGMRPQPAPVLATPPRQDGPPPERDPPAVQRERRQPDPPMPIPVVTASPLDTPRSPRQGPPAQITAETTPRLPSPSTPTSPRGPAAAPHHTALHDTTGPVHLMVTLEPPVTPLPHPAPGLQTQAAGFLSHVASRAASLVTDAASYVAGNDLLPAGPLPWQGPHRDTPIDDHVMPTPHGQPQDISSASSVTVTMVAQHQASQGSPGVGHPQDFSAEAGFSDIPLHDALPETAPLPVQQPPREIHEPLQRRRAFDVRSQSRSSDSSESDPQDRVETPRSSMRWETSGRMVPQPNRPETEGALQAGGAGTAVHPEPDASAPPPSRWTVLRDRLAEGLRGRPFSATDPEQLAEQRELEARYLDRAAQVAERRERAFGTTQPYEVGQPMRTQVHEGLLPAAYEGFQSFVTSAFRSPSGAVVGLSVQDNRNFFPVDQALTTSVLQGFMAYVAEGAMVSVNNRATLSNMPKIARNNFDGLLFEQEIQPDTVLLVMKNGRKEYMRADDPRASSTEAQTERVARKLSSIKLRQDLLDGKSFAFPAVPLMSGGFNTLRRFLSSASVLASPLPLFVTSALASGSASGVVKLGLEVGKTAAQVEIDDLMGGRQSVNLFRLTRPHADIEPLRWADARRLHGFLGETFRESLSLANEARRTFLHSAADMAYRYVLVNGIANMSGVGIGGMMGQVFRPERRFGALPGESPHSRANIAAQMVQSTFGDAIWRGMKEAMKGRELDANASLKLRRTTRMDEQWKEALRAQDALRTQVAGIRPDSALWAAQRPAAHGPGAGDIESHGNLRHRLLQQGPMDLDTLRGLRRELAALDLRQASAPEQADRDSLKQQLDRIIKPLSCRAATQQWLRPRD